MVGKMVREISADEVGEQNTAELTTVGLKGAGCSQAGGKSWRGSGGPGRYPPIYLPWDLLLLKTQAIPI